MGANWLKGLTDKFAKLERELAFAADDKAISGVIVTIDHEGELDIIDDLVRQEVRAAAKKKKAETNAEDGDTPPVLLIQARLSASLA